MNTSLIDGQTIREELIIWSKVASWMMMATLASQLRKRKHLCWSFIKLTALWAKTSTYDTPSVYRCSDQADAKDRPWVFKNPPLHIGSKRVVGLMSKGGAVLAKLVVALWDVHVPVPIQSDSVVRSDKRIHDLLLCFIGSQTWAGALRHKCLTWLWSHCIEMQLPSPQDPSWQKDLLPLVARVIRQPVSNIVNR